MDEHDIASINDGSAEAASIAVAATNNPKQEETLADVLTTTGGYITDTVLASTRAITSGVIDSGIEHAYDRAMATEKGKPPEFLSTNTLYNGLTQTGASFITTLSLGWLHSISETERERLLVTYGQPFGTGLLKLGADAIRGKINTAGDAFIRLLISIGSETLADMSDAAIRNALGL